MHTDRLSTVSSSIPYICATPPPGCRPSWMQTPSPNAEPPSPVDRMADASKNITLPQISLAGGKNYFPRLMASTDIPCSVYSYLPTPLYHAMFSFFIRKSLARNVLLCFLLRTFLSFFFLLYFFIRKDLQAKINIGTFVFLSTPSFSVSAPSNFFLAYFYFITFQENLNVENMLRLPVGLQDDFSFQLKFFLLCTLHRITNYGIRLHLFNSTYFKEST